MYRCFGSTYDVGIYLNGCVQYLSAYTADVHDQKK